MGRPSELFVIAALMLLVFSLSARFLSVAAERYFGAEPGKAWVAQFASMVQDMVQVTITPEWVGLLDFQTRFPSALPL